MADKFPSGRFALMIALDTHSILAMNLTQKIRPSQTIAITLLGLMSLATSADTTTEVDQPNVIIFLTDDQGYGDVGVYGAEDIKTPHIDSLAADGIRFTSFYAQPLCGPSRAALLTGSYPIRIAEPDNKKHPNTILHTDEFTIAEAFQNQGYATAAIGKWHLAGDGAPWDYAPPPKPPGRPGGKGPFEPARMPNAQGFDYFFGTPMHNGYTKEVDPARFIVDLMRDGQVIETQTDVDNLTQRYTAETIAFIRAHQHEPFFIYLAHNMPHVSLGVSKPFRGQSDRGLYGDVIQELDWSLGQILATLEALEIDDRTLVIFLSDNGPPIGNLTDSNGGNAGPLRGGKYVNWEGGVRVPAIMRWPDQIPAGQIDDNSATMMDVFPTLVALADLKLEQPLDVDGINLTGRLTGAVSQPQTIKPVFFYSLTTLQGVRAGQWKLVLPREANAPNMAWLGRYMDAVPSPQLFNLGDDIGEKNNLANQHPEIVSALMTEIEWARRHLGDWDRTGESARFFDQTTTEP